MGLRDLSLTHLVTHHARLAAGEPALILGQEALTFAQLAERSACLAQGLREKGVQKGDRICLLSLNHPAFLELLFASADVGAILVPFNWRLKPEEVALITERVEPKLFVVAGELEGLVSQVDRQTVSIWASMGKGSFEALDTFYAPQGELRGEGAGDDPCLILLTAAVEGVPRGALLSHHNLLVAANQLWIALGLGPWDRHLSALPLFHITGLGLSLAVMQAGGVNVLLERFDAQAGDRLMDEQGITLLADFPPVLATLLEARAGSGAEWKSLRYVLGLDSPEVIGRLLKETRAQFWTGYGQSETSGVVTLGSVNERPGAAGRPLPAAWVRCVDENDQPVGIDQPGEIVVRGPLVFQGYWRDPAATEFAFRNGWHHTGDLGKFDAQGYLYYLGRKPEKELIKSGGENVYPAEVENALRSLPQVREACVIGVPDARWGEAVKAVVELEPGAEITAQELIAAVAERIASYKKPRHVAFVERLPRTKDGQVDREAVKAEHGGG